METTLSKRSFQSLLDVPQATRPAEQWQPGSTQGKEPESTAQSSRFLSWRVCQEIPAPRAGAYGETTGEAVGIFMAGYFYKAPLRGQVTVCLTATLIHL